MKVCSKCKGEKMYENFRKVKPGKGCNMNLHSWCKECTRAARRQDYKDNRQRYLSSSRDWYKKNPSKHKEYYAKRPNQKEYWATWRETHPEQKKAYNINYRARKASAPGVLTQAVIQSVFDSYGKICLRCGSAKNIEIDHVIPLSLGGTNLFDNLQPLCKVHNSSKGNRNSNDYRPREGRASP